MNSGSDLRAALRAREAERQRLLLERDRLRREAQLRSAPGRADLAVLTLVMCAALVAAVWLLGADVTDERLSVIMLTGGLLGSGSAALMVIGRPSRWWPIPGARWMSRFHAVSGVIAAQGVYLLLGNEPLDALPAAQSDRLLVGFVAGIAAWKFLSPHRTVVVSFEGSAR